MFEGKGDPDLSGVQVREGTVIEDSTLSDRGSFSVSSDVSDSKLIFRYLCAIVDIPVGSTER